MTSGPTILVVEDEVLLLDTIVLELEDLNFSVLRAEDGARAIGIIQSADGIDLLFTDIRLPDRIDGWQVAEAARQRFPRIPIIYTTGYAPDPGREIPQGELLPKPYTMRDVLGALKRLNVSP